MLFLFKYSVFFVIFISPFYLTIAVSLIEFFPQFFFYSCLKLVFYIIEALFEFVAISNILYIYF